MAIRQTIRGILQFSDQEDLRRAMELVDAESDSTSIHEAFLAEGLMLFDLDMLAPKETWDDHVEAVGILAENASRGYVVCSIEGQDTEIWHAGQDHPVPNPQGDPPPVEEDYFPMVEGRSYTWSLSGEDHGDFLARVSSHDKNGQQVYFLENAEHQLMSVSGMLGASFFTKSGNFIYAIPGKSQGELNNLDADDNYYQQLVLNTAAEPGEIHTSIFPSHNRYNVYAIVGHGDVAVPHGTFHDCLRVRIQSFELSHDGQVYNKRAGHIYLAKGIGVVKYESGKLTAELKEYTS